MTSNMEEIEVEFDQYPEPGKDNSSQGFRDRYNIIRTNLNIAKEEISTLITDTAKLNTDNNFGGNKIVNTNLAQSTVEANVSQNAQPITSDTLLISYISGSVHVVRVGSSETPLALSFTNWPTATSNSGNRFAKITLIVNPPESGSRTLAWPEGIKKAKLDIDPDVANPLPSFDTQSVISVGGTKLFEVFTYDAGETLFVNYLGLYE